MIRIRRGVLHVRPVRRHQAFRFVANGDVADALELREIGTAVVRRTGLLGGAQAQVLFEGERLDDVDRDVRPLLPRRLQQRQRRRMLLRRLQQRRYCLLWRNGGCCGVLQGCRLR